MLHLHIIQIIAGDPYHVRLEPNERLLAIFTTAVPPDNVKFTYDFYEVVLALLGISAHF